MKNTVYTIVAACVAMLVTSGLLAFAFAAPPAPPTPEEAEIVIGDLLDAHYAEVVARHTIVLPEVGP